ncbi:MAG: flippase [Patescibacteria group bacterium]|jgi:O-antigen/teichoic acid export membrane protein
MSLAFNVAKNTIYQILGKALGTVLGLVTIGLMTRYLGQTGFGYYTTIISFLQFFGVVIDFGLQMTTAQMLARPGADENKIFGSIVTIRLISAAVFMGLAAAVVWLLPYPEIIKMGVTLTSLSFFFISLQSVFISVFQKNMKMSVVAWAEIWGRVALLAGVWIFVITSRGILYIMLAIVLGSLINFLYLYVKSREYLRPKFSYDKKLWKEIWTISWPLAVTISLSLIYFRADTVVMSFVRPQNEVGIYGAAYKVIEILTQFPYLFLGLLLPVFTSLLVVSLESFKKVFQKTFDFMAIITFPMVLGTVAVGDKIMDFVAGKEFLVSGDLLKILILAVGTIYFGAFFGYGVVACGLQKKMIKFYIFDAIFSLTCYLIFIPQYSYWAAATLTVISELLITIPALFILRKHIGMHFKFNIFLKSLLASLIMLGVLLLLSSQNLATLIIIGIIIYFSALYLMRGIDKSTVMEIMKYKG